MAVPSAIRGILSLCLSISPIRPDRPSCRLNEFERNEALCLRKTRGRRVGVSYPEE